LSNLKFFVSKKHILHVNTNILSWKNKHFAINILKRRVSISTVVL